MKIKTAGDLLTAKTQGDGAGGTRQIVFRHFNMNFTIFLFLS